MVLSKVISVQDVSWRRSNRLILDQLSWDVLPGEHWAIIGLNGSGKTSLLNMITGYQWPTSGQVHVLGSKIGAVQLAELRKSIGWVSLSLHNRYRTQEAKPVLEVVISGKFASIGLYETYSKADEAKALELLQRFAVMHLADKPFSTLSEGERQKVILARAWMANPSLIILDEPCNGLDIKARENLLETIELLASAPEGPTLLYVTHRLEEIMPSFTHALLLNKGKVVASGKKEEVFTIPLLEETFELPVQLHWQDKRAWLSGRR